MSHPKRKTLADQIAEIRSIMDAPADTADEDTFLAAWFGSMSEVEQRHFEASIASIESESDVTPSRVPKFD